MRFKPLAVVHGDGGSLWNQWAAPRPSISGPLAAGLAVVGVFFGAFGGWASLAPIESAAVAPGIVSVASNRKTVQHLEGGIIAHIGVRDGDKVAKGQVLVTLDDTKARTHVALLRDRLRAETALEARLIAERDGTGTIAFPSWLAAERAIPKVAEAVAGQMRIFASHRKSLAHRVAIVRKKSAQSHEEIVGLRRQIAAENRQLSLIREETGDIRTLVERGLARKPRLLALEGNEAKIDGARGRNVASIAQAKQAISEGELRIAQLRADLVKDATESLRDVQTKLTDVTDRLRAAEDVLKRTKITAPIDGTIVKLRVHTAGGVIAPGAPLMDIVPGNDRRIVEARIDPSDIDVVHPGLAARIRLTALPQRNLVPIKGKVVSVSADRLVDRRTGRAYYRARIALTQDPTGTPAGVSLYPGMQAEVLIVTGSRTLLDYIVEPLMNTLNRALRES